jgi:hypothetical protein
MPQRPPRQRLSSNALIAIQAACAESTWFPLGDHSSLWGERLASVSDRSLRN